MFNTNSSYFVRSFVILFITYLCQADNCKSHICVESTPTLCKFEVLSNPGSHCVDYEVTIKTSRDKYDILDKINTRRDKIASGDIRSLPSAENMVKMEWSDELETSAQWWANQCIPYGNLNSIDICTGLDKVNVGQNIATIIGDSPGLTPAVLVDVWYMELFNINASLISRYRPSNRTGVHHYDYFTQLAWAESNLVGCGGVKFKDFADKRQNRTVNRLVCNFAPGGNLIGQRVYNEGFPCSQCPSNGLCDLKYSSLCDSEPTAIEKRKFKEYGIKFNSNYLNVSINMHVTNSNQNNTSRNEELNDDKYFPHSNTGSESFHMQHGEENATFDYFAHLFSPKINTVKITNNLNTCKEVMPVEDFIDIFKKRLIKDQVLKQFLLSSKISDIKEHSESGFTDATIAELMSHIYSTKEVSTTTKPLEPDYFNSTLLVDLVEAVIFKNNDKSSTTEKVEQNTNLISDVSAIRIKPEFGEIQANLHSTGHYFFPEEDNEQGIKDTTDTYYDISSVPVSDIVLEIQELKRNRGTKDFLDEILESDFGADNVSDSNFPSSTSLNSDKNGSDKVFLEKFEIFILNKSMLRSKRSDHELNTELNLKINDRIEKRSSFQIKNSDHTVHLIDYQDFLRKIALDLDILKLNDRFHCSGTFSHCSYTKPSPIVIFLFLILFY